MTFSPFLKGNGTILRKHLPFLHNSPKLKQIFPGPPLTAFRRPSNLRYLVVHAKVKTPTSPQDPPGAYKCRKECIVCIFFDTSTKFTTTKCFPILSFLSCETNWLIYLIIKHISAAQKQYVGKNRNFIVHEI